MQQINLLNGGLILKTQHWVAKHFLMTWAGFAFLLVIFTSWQGLSLWELKSEMSQTETDVQKLRAANEIARTKSAEPSGMRDQIAALQVQQREQDSLVELLRSQQQSRGFSEYLTGLANAHVDGLWLNEIEIVHDRGRRISLRGSALNARFVPLLLRNLAAEQQFSGQRFEQLELQGTGPGELVDFSLISPNGDVSG